MAKRTNWVASGLAVALAVMILVGPAANGDPADSWRRTPLIQAALKGDAAAVQALLAQGAAVNAKDQNGMTALMWAVPEVVPLLLKSGADVHARDNAGRTALTYAALQVSASALRALLDRGAEVDPKDRDGLTPLFWAIERQGLMHWLSIADGSPDQFIVLSLSHRLFRQETKVRAAQVMDSVALLLDRGANPNAHDKSGRTPLMASGWQLDIANILLAKRANIDSQDSKGNSALMWAVMGSNVEFVRLLLRHGADLTIQRRDGRTVRSLAVEAHWGLGVSEREREQVKTLLEEAANISRAKRS